MSLYRANWAATRKAQRQGLLEARAGAQENIGRFPKKFKNKPAPPSIRNRQERSTRNRKVKVTLPGVSFIDRESV